MKTSAGCPSSLFAPRRLVLALAACSFMGASVAGPALPSGLQVAQGQASLSTNGKQLTVTNSNGAILNWSSFSIGAQNTVTFVQPSSTSQVLNRVTGNDPSQILGSLISNGKVWLLNPNGVLFGQGARVDVASLVTSTLNLKDQDWLAGRYLFSADLKAPAAEIRNQGEIRASSGGQVLLLASGGVSNEGLIEAQGGQITLAAGASVELVDTTAPGFSVKVTAPTGQVVNLGTLSAAGGRIDVMAASVNQQGIVRADSLAVGPAGEIVMNANGGRLTLAAGSVTSADGGQGGGQIQLLGNQIDLADGSTVSANGALGGGTVLVGGGAQGKDASVPNSDAVYFAPAASIAANATQSGDGGHIVLWSNTATRAYGSLSATGGAQGGNGGLIETSGHWLDARPSSLNVSAPRGSVGTWLLDPIDVTIDDTPGDNFVNYASGVYTPTGEGSHISTGSIATALNGGTNVNITTTSASPTDPGDINASGTVKVTAATPGRLMLTADHAINYHGAIVSMNGPLAITLLSGNGGIGGITLTGANLVSKGGDITLGGFQNNGRLPNGSTFSGAANGATGTGISISNSTLDAGIGQLNIYGYGNNGGVDIPVVSNLKAGDLTIYGYSLAGIGVNVLQSNIGATHSVNVQGNGNNLGIAVSNAGNFYVAPASPDPSASLTLTALGHSPGEAMLLDNSNALGVILRVTNGATLSVSAANQAGGNPALSLIGYSTNTLMVDAASGGGLMQFNATGANNTLSLLNVDLQAGSGGLLLNAGGNITVTGSAISSGGAMPISLLAGQSLANVGAINLTGTSISSSGGDITLGGYATGITPQGGSFGNAATSLSTDAVSLSGTTLNGGSTGNISISGTSQGNNGVYLQASSALVGRNISINGSAPGSGATGVFIDSSTLYSPGSILVQGYSDFGSALAVAGNTVITASPPVAGSGSTLSLIGASGGLNGGVSIELSGGGSITAGNGTAMTIIGGNAVPAGQVPVAVLVTGTLDASSGGPLTIGTLGNSNMIALDNAIILGSVQGVTISGANTLDMSNSQISANGAIQVMADNVSFGTGTLLTSNRPTGDAIVLQGIAGPMTSFSNGAGANALSALGGLARWIIWDADISGSFFVPGALPYGFTLYGANDASVWSGIAGNGYVSQAPGTAYVTGNLITKSYDSTVSAQLQGSLSANGPRGPLANFVSAVQFADKNAGNGKTILVTPPSSFLDSANMPVYGLSVQSLVVGNILPLQVALSGGTIQDKVYDTTTSASFNSPFTANFFAGDAVAVTGGTATFNDKRVGNAKFVSVSGLALSGADAGNYTLPLTVNTSGNITPASLLLSGLTANNKVYDATTVASFSGGGSVTPMGSDAVFLVGTAGGGFSTKNVGNGLAVTVSGLSLGGADSGNYVLVEPSNLTANITPATLTVNGLAATNKVYDATTVAALSGSGSISALGSDQVLLSSGSAQFATKDVGSNKTVLLSGFSLSGLDAGNYALSASASLTADITPATLVVSGLSANNKVYDATRVATLAGAGNVAALGGDQVSLVGGTAQFSDKNVGNGKTVVLSGYALGGADAGNYVLSAPASLSADITPATLNISGLAANNKVYDTTTAATISGSANVLALGSDSVNVTGTLIGSFADKNVGSAKPVTLSGASLGGTDAGNYVLGAPPGLTATITAAPLTVSGLTANDKVYDASTAATLSGSARIQPLGSDQVSLGGSAVGAFADKNVGTDKRVLLSGLALSGPDAGNYAALTPDLSASVTPATLTYLADPANKLASAAVPALSGTVNGFVGGETQATATSGSLSFNTTASADSTAGSYAVNGQGLSAQNYQFVQADSNANALTVAGPPPVTQAPEVIQAIATPPVVTVASSGGDVPGGLLNLLEAPGAGVPSPSPSPSTESASATAQIVAQTSVGGASATPATATAQSFAPVRLSGLSMNALSTLLAGRDLYKQALFADAAVKLQKDPSLADAKVCTTLKEADNGLCLVSEALRRESRAKQQQQQQQQPQQQQLAVAADPAAQLSAAPPAAGGVTVAATAAPTPVVTHRATSLPARRHVKTAALPQIERKVAVVIGVDDYQDKSIPRLGNAVNDAEAVGHVLEDQLGYETVVIANASKAAVISALNRLALEVGPKDSVVIYYAGHGDVVEATKQGYWLLSDADAKKPETWLSNADIGRQIAQIDASQVALISDSCYSGSLVTERHIRAGTTSTVDPTQLLAEKSVVVMSSGGNEPVFDTGKQGHSPFSWNLMEQLGKVSKWQLGGNVFARVRFAVARELPQRPQYGSSSGLGGASDGDYLFEQRQLDNGAL
ncbi:MAG TPA: YDG domain-containing protein [Burkholderiaceae bacterium]